MQKCVSYIYVVLIELIRRIRAFIHHLYCFGEADICSRCCKPSSFVNCCNWDCNCMSLFVMCACVYV